MYSNKQLGVLVDAKLVESDNEMAEKLFKQVIDASMASKETTVKRDNDGYCRIEVGSEVTKSFNFTDAQRAALTNYCNARGMNVYVGFNVMTFGWRAE